MEKYQDYSNFMLKSCSEFTELLAAKIAMPGGGSAASLAGALGIALCSMSANFTLDKKNYESVQDDMKEILQKSEKIRVRLLELADEDAKAYLEFVEASKIFRENPERIDIHDNAALNACKAPLEIMKLCAESIDLISEVMEKGNKMLISDSACGALLCSSAMQSAAMNVYTNTISLKDRKKALKIEAEVDEMLKKYCPASQVIVEKVTKFLRK